MKSLFYVKVNFI